MNGTFHLFFFLICIVRGCQLLEGWTFKKKFVGVRGLVRKLNETEKIFFFKDCSFTPSLLFQNKAEEKRTSVLSKAFLQLVWPNIKISKKLIETENPTSPKLSVNIFSVTRTRRYMLVAKWKTPFTKKEFFVLIPFYFLISLRNISFDTKNPFIISLFFFFDKFYFYFQSKNFSWDFNSFL